MTGAIDSSTGTDFICCAHLSVFSEAKTVPDKQQTLDKSLLECVNGFNHLPLEGTLQLSPFCIT